ncbi:kinase-like domain-containing protein [Mycena maculata]|uniref:non-specific serine/threonine protein kinase n=1 Tax=Mycena maculata TaxID=230809 RepID=A0AAD7KCI0_9AGAR|nr:kinase-like domain-containing protein [Mycena maculata]
MSTPLLPACRREWPTSHSPEDLFRFVVEHISGPLHGAPTSSPWVTSTSATLHRTIVKRPKLETLEIDGRILHNDFDVATSFARELRLLRTVTRHANIVEFYGHIDGVGLVIEAVDGVPIGSKIEGRPVPSDPTKLMWANQLIRAIHHIHSFEVSHGDISSGNIIIDNEDNVKLIDFGRSARAGEELFPTTHPFTAPDILQSSHNPSLSDTYALGVLLLCLERNEILEDMVAPEELSRMALPLFGHLVSRYTAKDGYARPKIDLAHLLPVSGEFICFIQLRCLNFAASVL